MEQDNNLKDLLGRHALEETSGDFASNTMQKIQTLHADKKVAIETNNKRFKSALAISAIAAVVALLIALRFITPSIRQLTFEIEIPKITYGAFYKVVSFLAALWLLLWVNLLYEKSKFKKDDMNYN